MSTQSKEGNPTPPKDLNPTQAKGTQPKRTAKKLQDNEFQASGSGIDRPGTWGRHIPAPSMCPHIRLQCCLMDALTSSSPSTSAASDPEILHLANEPHEEGPYFVEGQWKLCWNTEIHAYDLCTPTVLSVYGVREALGDDLDGGRVLFRIFTCIRNIEYEGRSRPFYTIWAEAEARNYNNQVVKALDSEGKPQDLKTLSTLEWPKPLEGEEDLTPGLDWKCLVTLMAKHIGMKYGPNGVLNMSQVSLGMLLADKDPLKHLGYLGWPCLNGLTGTAADALKFRRDKSWGAGLK